MIWSVKGPVLASGLDWLVIDVGGIGMKVMAPATTISEVTVAGVSQAQLFTEMVVREDSMTLYGFTTTDARDTFVVLLGVSGIGPRTALAALSVMTPQRLRQAVEESDESQLTKIPGVGKKSAQRMLLELGGKLPQSSGSTPSVGSVRSDVETALEGLGWPKATVTKTLDALGPDYVDAGDLLRAALQRMGGSRV